MSKPVDIFCIFPTVYFTRVWERASLGMGCAWMIACVEGGGGGARGAKGVTPCFCCRTVCLHLSCLCTVKNACILTGVKTQKCPFRRGLGIFMLQGNQAVKALLHVFCASPQSLVTPLNTLAEQSAAH